MDSDSENQIPVIDLSRSSPDCDWGTEGWNNLSKRVREACETYGCFEVVYDKISMLLRAEAFSSIRQLFVLPMETKEENFNPKPYHGYAGQIGIVPLYESFGIEDVTNHEALKSFTELMWPHGHKQFRYGLGQNSDSIMECKTLLRVMRYKAPPAGEYMNGLTAHTDKLLCTLLCEDQVSGLEVETKDGSWMKISPSPNPFIFLVGDPLMAWSNGSLHAAKHRVVMSGDRDGYSLGAFAVPIDGTIIKPPKVLIDEYHPQLLKEFDFTDLLRFSFSKEGRAIESAMQMITFARNRELSNNSC